MRILNRKSAYTPEGEICIHICIPTFLPFELSKTLPHNYKLGYIVVVTYVNA
jgi:hypothetical protein